MTTKNVRVGLGIMCSATKETLCPRPRHYEKEVAVSLDVQRSPVTEALSLSLLNNDGLTEQPSSVPSWRYP